MDTITIIIRNILLEYAHEWRGWKAHRQIVEAEEVGPGKPRPSLSFGLRPHEHHVQANPECQHCHSDQEHICVEPQTDQQLWVENMAETNANIDRVV